MGLGEDEVVLGSQSASDEASSDEMEGVAVRNRIGQGERHPRG